MEMTPLPCGLAAAVTPLVAWRVDALVHRLRWDSGIGAERAGGRWNPKGMRVVYCSFDPATTVLELAVHKGFDVLDSVAHVITCGCAQRGLAACGYPQRGPAELGRGSSGAPSVCGLSQRGFEAELESGLLPDRGRGPLQPAGAGSAGDRRPVEPALALSDQTPRSRSVLPNRRLRPPPPPAPPAPAATAPGPRPRSPPTC